MKSSSIIKTRSLDLLQGCAVGFLSALLSNARVLGSFSPFGISFAAAIPKEYSLFALAGSACGYVIFGGITDNSSYIAALLLVTIFKFFIHLKGHTAETDSVIQGVIASVSLLTTTVISIVLHPVSTITILLKGSEVLLCGSMAFMVSMVVHSLSSPSHEYRFVEKASFAILCTITFLSLAPLELWNFRVARIIGIICICIGMYWIGYAGGVLVAILFTIAMTLYDTNLAVSSGCLIVAAFIGGVFRPLGKIAQVTMFIASATFSAVVLGVEQVTTLDMVEVLLGSAVFFFFPDNILNRLFTKEKIPKVHRTHTDGMTSKLEFVADSLTDLQHSIEKVSNHMEAAAENDIFHIYAKTSEKVCKNCGLNTFCWGAAYGDMTHALNNLTKLLRTKGKVEKDTAPFFFQQKCCQPEEFLQEINLNYKEFLAKEAATRRVVEARLMAINQLEGISGMLCEMSKELSDIIANDPKANLVVQEAFQEIGCQPKEIHCYYDKYDRLYCDIYLAQRPDDFHLEQISEQLTEHLNREMELPSVVSSDLSTKVSYFERANFRVDFHASQISNNNNRYCGDSFEYFMDSKGFAHIILSDGMGSGARAAVDSTMTCSIARKLLQTGFGFDATFQLVNLAFLVKSREESLATLDVCTIDLYTGMAEFAKSGAASSFVMRNGKVVRIECSSLPIGILQGIQYDKEDMKLNRGDLVVMVSDGALASGEDWISSELELYSQLSSREISQKLCAEAQRRRIDGHSDDITVVAIRLKK